MGLSREEQLQLVERARRGDERQRERALAALLEDFRGAAMAVIHRALAAAGVGREHAEEAWLQAAFKFYSVGLERFAGRAAPRSYFVRMALNSAIDIVRAQSRQAPLDEPAQPDSRRSAEALLAREQLLAALRRCVAALPPDYQRAVTRYYLEERGTCEACAAEEGIAKLSFMKRLQRARDKLASCLRDKLHWLAEEHR